MKKRSLLLVAVLVAALLPAATMPAHADTPHVAVAGEWDYQGQPPVDEKWADGGRTYRVLPLVLNAINDPLQPATSQRLLLGTRYGLYESSDQGNTLTDSTPKGMSDNAWFTALAPEMTRPSRAMRAPGGTMKRSPGSTPATGPSASVPSARRRRTVGGARSSSAAIARRARPTLQLSRTSDRANRKVTVAASNHSPIAMAPNTATVISKLISGRRLRAADQALMATNRPPKTTAAR